MESLILPLDYNAIERILPHRFPFLLVDRITELEPDKRIVGIKNVSRNERYLAHQPGESPALPPTILTECVAQVGAILILWKPENRDKLPFFMGIKRVRYRHPGLRRRCRRNRGARQTAAQPDGRARRLRAGQRPHRRRRHDDVCAGADSGRTSRRAGLVPATAPLLRPAATPPIFAARLAQTTQRLSAPKYLAVSRIAGTRMTAPITGSSIPALIAIPRVSRSFGPVRANAAPEYATDVRTLNARMPLSTGACSSRSAGCLVSRYSLTACCAQNPADEMTNSRAGLTASCVIAKNGSGTERHLFHSRRNSICEVRYHMRGLVNRQPGRSATDEFCRIPERLR